MLCWILSLFKLMKRQSRNQYKPGRVLSKVNNNWQQPAFRESQSEAIVLEMAADTYTET